MACRVAALSFTVTTLGSCSLPLIVKGVDVVLFSITHFERFHSYLKVFSETEKIHVH